MLRSCMLLVPFMVVSLRGAAAAPARPLYEPPALSQPTTQVVATTSGLKYLDMTIGSGRPAVRGNTVSVHYVGTFPDGKKFDSSRDRAVPFDFQLGQGLVIKGWDEGLVGMKEGGKRKLIIPPELGYGDRGTGGVIPPKAILIFEVELLKVK
ncbi:MAG: FKBP-type peptidyl-prolyl cis-trans isomerase [Planctomycetes bacterium]|nr:FKBP-type peptidyl-prolyl cis-trans isomerase [Planctomycetota bacterium]